MNESFIKIFINPKLDINDPKVHNLYGKFASTFGIITNILISVIKIIIGSLANSIAIIADGVNNLTDAISSIITYLGFHLSERPEDKNHPYGHARIENISAFIVSFIILIVGILLFISSFKKIFHPESLQIDWIVIGILILSIFGKVWQSTIYFNLAKKINSESLRAVGIDSRNDIISTVAVLIGIAIYEFTGLQIDGFIGCGVSVFIAYSGISLNYKILTQLVGAAPDENMVKNMTELIKSHKIFITVHEFNIHNYGYGKTFGTVHVEVDSKAEFLKTYHMIELVEKEILNNYKVRLLIYMEPIVLNDPEYDRITEVIKEVIAPYKGLVTLHSLYLSRKDDSTNVNFELLVGCDLEVKNKSAIEESLTHNIKAINKNYSVTILYNKIYTVV